MVLVRKRTYHNPATAVKRMSFKKLAWVLKEDNCELYMARITKFIHPKLEKVNVADNFKDILAEYEDIFRETLPEELPPSRCMEFEINLISGELAPVRPFIRLSPS